MKNIISTEKTKRALLFSLALAMVMALVFLLAFSLKEAGIKTSDKPIEASILTINAAELLSTNERLQQKLSLLHELEGKYAAAVIDTGLTINTDSLSKLILLEENNFRDAVKTAGEKEAAFEDGKIKEGYKKMIAAYLTFIESRKLSGVFRNVVAIKSSHLEPDEKQQLSMQNEVTEKSNRIALLEIALQQLKDANKGTVRGESNNAKLLSNIEALEDKLAASITSNEALKLDNEKLQQLQAGAVKRASTSEKLLKDRNMVLQQRIDELSAEIQLVKVDCNLNRVDATQIISNAKQRRRLLNEASEILTGLSVSTNTDIGRKVKEKIGRLNQVSANYRE